MTDRKYNRLKPSILPWTGLIGAVSRFLEWVRQARAQDAPPGHPTAGTSAQGHRLVDQHHDRVAANGEFQMRGTLGDPGYSGGGNLSSVGGRNRLRSNLPVIPPKTRSDRGFAPART